MSPQAGPRAPGAVPGAAPGRGRKRLTDREKRNLRMGLLFISPWMIGVTVFVVYPLVYSFVISLAEYSGMQSPTFIGLQNYITAAGDPLVHTSVANSAYYMALAVRLGLVIALLLAMAMNRNVREVALYRTLLYMPSLIPMFAMSFIFIVFVNPQFGIVNQVLGLFGMPDTNLLGEPGTAKLVIILMAQLGAGNAALIYLAGLAEHPRHAVRGRPHRRCRTPAPIHLDHPAAADPHDPVQPDHGRLRGDDGVHRGVHHDRRRTGQFDAVLHAVSLPQCLLLRAAGLRFRARGAALPVRNAAGRTHLLALAPVRELRRLSRLREDPSWL